MSKQGRQGTRRNLPAPREEPPPQVTSITASFWQGQLPHPEDLAKYEAILPGAAERIFTAFELQATHRRGLETKVTDANISHQGFALKAATWTLTLLMLSGIIVGLLGQPIAGYTGAVASAISAIFTTYWAAREARKERLVRDERARAMLTR